MGFTGQMTQPTVSMHWRKYSPKDRLQSHQVHLTMLQYHTCMQCIQSNESTHSEMDPVRQNQIQRTVRSVHTCVHCTVHNCCTQLHTTDLIIFPLTLQTIAIAPMMSICTPGMTMSKPIEVFLHVLYRWKLERCTHPNSMHAQQNVHFFDQKQENELCGHAETAKFLAFNKFFDIKRNYYHETG